MSTFIVGFADPLGALFREKVRRVGSGEKRTFASKRDVFTFLDVRNAVQGAAKEPEESREERAIRGAAAGGGLRPMLLSPADEKHGCDRNKGEEGS